MRRSFTATLLLFSVSSRGVRARGVGASERPSMVRHRRGSVQAREREGGLAGVVGEGELRALGGDSPTLLTLLPLLALASEHLAAEALHHLLDLVELLEQRVHLG